MKRKELVCAIMAMVMFLSCIGFSSTTYAEKGDLGEGYNFEISDKEFEAVEGGTVNTGAKGVVTILMFGKTDGSCVNSTNMIEWFCTAPWINDERVRFVFVDYNKDSKEHITSISEKYKCGNAKFAYCPDDTANALMWKYADKIQGKSMGFNIPLTVIKDADNKVQYGFFGVKTPNQVRKYVEDLVGDTLKDTSGPDAPDEGKKDDCVQFYIEGICNEEEAMKVYELVNKEREKLGFKTAQMDATLTKRAMQRAAECAVNFSHTRPDGDPFYTVLDNIYLHGCAENIAAGQKDAEEVMESWMNSEGHRKNLLNYGYSSIGVGCFEHNGVRYWVQLFSTVLDEEMTETKVVTKEAVVTATKTYCGRAFLYRGGSVEVGKEGKTVFGVSNGQGRYAFRPSKKNFTFESKDTSILTVASSGAVTGVAPGETSVSIKVDGISIGTSKFKVVPNQDQPSAPPASTKPEVSKPPASTKPEVSKPPASTKPEVSEPPASTTPAPGKPEDTKNTDAATGKKYGDSDKNGVINLQDARLALKVALKLSSADEAGIRIMSGGGERVEIRHAQKILKIALKLQKAFYE